MKIHKKILTHYLSCTSPVDKEGYLYKMKERTATYHRRWFVLKGNVLFYQERPADRHLLGVVVLEGCAVRRCEADGGAGPPCCFSLVSRAPGLRAYRFAAEDRLTQEGWVRALLSASHRYLALLVGDLGRQYEEAKREQARVEDGSSAASGSADGGNQHQYHQNPHQHQHQHHQYQQQSVVRPRPGSLLTVEAAKPDVREERSFSAGHEAQGTPTFPARAAHKKPPKHWARRNAHVTPLNGPAPPYGEWPSVGLDPLESFAKVHEHYGEEVLRVREAWLRRRKKQQEEEEEEEVEEHGDKDLMDFM
ncbi:unnamed protein product [Merluccius merluccius]